MSALEMRCGRMAWRPAFACGLLVPSGEEFGDEVAEFVARTPPFLCLEVVPSSPGVYGAKHERLAMETQELFPSRKLVRYGFCCLLVGPIRASIRS